MSTRMTSNHYCSKTDYAIHRDLFCLQTSQSILMYITKVLQYIKSYKIISLIILLLINPRGLNLICWSHF